MRVVFVGPEEPSFLLSLGGIETVVATTFEEAREALTKLISEQDVGVVLLASDFYTEEIASLVPRRGNPIVVSFPVSIQEVEEAVEDPQIIQVEKMLGLR